MYGIFKIQLYLQRKAYRKINFTSLVEYLPILIKRYNNAVSNILLDDFT